MDGKWIVYYQERIVGSCSLERQGLYYRIFCRCEKAVDGICRLMLQCGDDAVDLGILVPMESGFGLEKRIPVKNLPDGEPRFYIRPADEKREEVFASVRAGEPFAFLARLEDARFARRGGEVGILLQEQRPC